VDGRKGQSPQLKRWTKCQQLLTVKTYPVTIHSQMPRTWLTVSRTGAEADIWA